MDLALKILTIGVVFDCAAIVDHPTTKWQFNRPNNTQTRLIPESNLAIVSISSGGLILDFITPLDFITLWPHTLFPFFKTQLQKWELNAHRNIQFYQGYKSIIAVISD